MREKDMQIIGALYVVCLERRPGVDTMETMIAWCDMGMSPTLITAALLDAGMSKAHPAWDDVAVNIMAAWVAGAYNAFDYWQFVRAREEAGQPLDG